jgi:hypothetical protein
MSFILRSEKHKKWRLQEQTRTDKRQKRFANPAGTSNTNTAQITPKRLSTVIAKNFQKRIDSGCTGRADALGTGSITF